MMAETGDRELMLAVRAGEFAALDQLFVRHHARLYGFLARLSGDPQVAEDLVQEVFLRLLRFRERYDGRGEFLSWLYQIARNLAADHHAKHRPNESLQEDAPYPDEGIAPLDRLTEVEEHERLARTLATLPFHHREVLLLRTVSELSHRDLALALGCSESAARVRLHRAIAALRREWHILAGEPQ